MIDGPLGGAAFNNEFGRPNLGGYFRVYEQTVGRRAARLPQADHDRRRPRRDRGVADAEDRVPGRHAADPARRPGHAHRHGRRRGELDGGRRQRRRARLRLGAARQPRDPAPRAGGHQPLLGARRGQPDPRDPRRRRRRHLATPSPSWSTAPAGARASTCARCRSRRAAWRRRRSGATRARSATCWRSRPESLPLFDAMCERERCPFAVVGVATDERELVLEDGPGGERADRHADGRAARQAAEDAPRREARRRATRRPLDLDRRRRSAQVAFDVLRHPTVASKRFLITIGDRTVGGLTHRDPMVGPWQVPVADCAVTLADYAGFRGEAMAMGERTPLAALDAPASGRMAVGEAITNLLAAPIELDARQAQLQLDGRLRRARRGRRALRHRAGGRHGAVPGARHQRAGRQGLAVDAHALEATAAQAKQVTAPVCLIVTAFATLDDVRGTLTPQLQPGDTTLILIDLGRGRMRMGGSMLAQVLGQFGDAVPDLDDPALLKALVAAINRAARRRPAARVPRPQRRRPVGRGLRDGVRRPPRREPERRPARHRRRRHRRQPRRVRRLEELGRAGRARGASELTLRALFNEELGAVIQVPTARARRGDARCCASTA